MECIRFDDADDFWRRFGAFLGAGEIENNVILGIVRALRDKPEDGAVMLGVVDGSVPKLVAVMTPPHRLVVSNGETAALGCLAECLRRGGVRPPGVVGPVEMSEAFAATWRECSGDTVTPATEMTLYIADNVTMPDPVAGEFRRADDGDTDRVAEWTSDFSDELNMPPTAQAQRRKAARDGVARGELFFWEVDGAPASMAGFRETAAAGARVNLVYTPSAERQKGYASACVAHLTRHLLSSGISRCVIFADVANPTSNGIYRRMGYKEAGTYREYDFAAADRAELGWVKRS